MRYKTHNGESCFGRVSFRIDDNRTACGEERGEGGGGEERERCRGEEVEKEVANCLKNFRVAAHTFLSRNIVGRWDEVSENARRQLCAIIRDGSVGT